MIRAIATVAEIKNDFDKYLDEVLAGNEVVVTKDGKVIGRLVPYNAPVSFLSDALVGVLDGDVDLDEARRKGIAEKHGANV
jgi:prevent-host-death family protein